jgi:predicted metalloenzyme YecM
LGTSDHSIALKRWPDAYKALEQELQLRIQQTNADTQRLRVSDDNLVERSRQTG